MGSMSIWHWLIFLFVAASTTVPFIKIFPRAGIPSWVGVFGLIPVVPLVFLWILAFKKWPGDQQEQS
jgi:hypothetical protein